MTRMKAETKIKLKIITSLIGVLCTVFVLSASLAYAWFAFNDKVSASNMKIEASDPYKIFFVGASATKTSLDGSYIKNKYKIENGSLVLEESIAYNSDDSVDDAYEQPTSTNFLFDEILPGEAVTVTIDYYLDEELAGSTYHVSLYDFSSSGTFELEVDSGEHQGTYKYYVVGAFKYKPIEAKFYSDENMTSELTDKTITYSEDYKFIDTYVAFQDEVLPSSVDFNSLTWEQNYKRGSFTFELSEDISGFYKLVNESGAYYSNLLSKKALNIKSLRVVVDELEG